MSFGPVEAIVIVVVVLVVFGAGRLSGVGKALGQGLREFREEAKVEDEESADDGSDSDEEKAKEEETSS
ncbi:MAG: twin-arginine translocase TatA/TatE family subunit [Chloroflexi bacterium]|jgi:sec-independent protein translocase protein TatA|nr:twin-arginine translocase TatA/TatE family subunit [Chloroflexota bacterium]MCZ6707770.1 twin-arginine translocase TatA/TatE family subunit [Chloroflexota bacterium]